MAIFLADRSEALRRPELAKAALTILDKAIPETIEVEGADSFSQPRCPKCGSLDTSSEGWTGKLDYLSAWAGFPVPVKTNSSKRLSCGYHCKTDLTESTE